MEHNVLTQLKNNPDHPVLVKRTPEQERDRQFEHLLTLVQEIKEKTQKWNSRYQGAYSLHRVAAPNDLRVKIDSAIELIYALVADSQHGAKYERRLEKAARVKITANDKDGPNCHGCRSVKIGYGKIYYVRSE